MIYEYKPTCYHMYVDVGVKSFLSFHGGSKDQTQAVWQMLSPSEPSHTHKHPYLSLQAFFKKKLPRRF